LSFVGLTTGCADKPTPIGKEPEPVAEKPKLPADEPDPGPYIERVEEVEECFEMAGFEINAYRYSGGGVECWVEVETDGKKEIVVKSNRGSVASIMARSPHDPKDFHGYILLIGRNPSRLEYGAPPIWAEETKGARHLVTKFFSGMQRKPEPLGEEAPIEYFTSILPVVTQPSGENESAEKPSQEDKYRFHSRIRDHAPLQPKTEVILVETGYKLEDGEQGEESWASVYRLKCRLAEANAPEQKPEQPDE